MLRLFLRESTRGHDSGDDELCTRRNRHLDELGQAVWSMISSRGRSEARLWLCNTVAGIRSISPRRQRDLFVSLMRSKPMKRHLASQVLQLVFEKQPQRVGPIIAKESHKLENFFKGNPRRILEWFSNFSATGKCGHSPPGAKALSQFAFINRDICWEELEWKGKHGQSPVMVATKPHYFLDLDVQRTMKNFLENVPEFWSSAEFSESLKDGSILSLDTKYFANFFIDLMYKEQLEEAWVVIEDFLTDQSFSFLCHHLLIILEEQELCMILDMLPKYVKPKSGPCNTVEWFEVILSKYSYSGAVNQLLLLNAVTNHGRHLLRLVHEESSEEEKEKIKDLVESLTCANDLAAPIAILEEDFRNNPLEYIKTLGLHSWAIHFRLAEGLHTPESWESLFINNGISFHKSDDKYDLVNDDNFSEDCGSDYDRSVAGLKSKKKHKKHKKKRKRRSTNDGNYEGGFSDYDLSSNRLDLPSKGGDWLLSTDGYATTWSSVDLPGHISRHCFVTWLNRVFAKGVVP